MRVLIPLHVTGFWYVVKSYHPLFTGSLGAGLTLDPPIIAEPWSSECKVVINDECVEFPTVKLAHKLGGFSRHLTAYVKSKASLGEGYGLSAALTLAYLAINIFNNSKSTTWNKVASLAHIAEVLNETGYGDVIAEVYGGGLVIRTSAGPPGIGSIDVIPLSNSLRVITIPLGKLTTTDMFKRYRDRINEVGITIYRKFIEAPSIESFAQLAYEFSVNVGMLDKELDELLRSKLLKYLSNGCVLGYFVKKKLLCIICEDSCVADVFNSLIKYFNSVKIFNIARHGSLMM